MPDMLAARAPDRRDGLPDVRQGLRRDGRGRVVRVVVYTTAERPPLVVPNRYPSGLIGVAIRVGRRRLLSIVWRKP